MVEDRIRVLLVEDNPGDARLIKETLRDEPGASEFELVVAGALREAFDRLAAERFAVVLLDLSLPDSHGFETFLRLHEQYPDVATVVLTGLDDENLAVRAVQEGAQDYLVKGDVSGGVLVRSLRYAIERQRTSHYLAVMVERERFDAAMSQMSDGLVVTDERLRITTANRAAQLLLNLPENDEPQTLEAALRAFQPSVPLVSLEESTERVTAFEIARENTRPPLYIDARLTRLFDSRRALVSTVLLLRDVTEERRERKAQVDFFNLLSHKLRTPLTVLTGYLEILKNIGRERWGPDAQRILLTCRDEVDRLSDTVTKLLDFKRLSTASPEVRGLHTDVASVAREVCDQIRERYPDRRLQIRCEVPDGVLVADAQPEHTRFALLQLLDNAAKFSDKNPARIELSIRREDGQLVFSVADNGPGIPHEYRDKVFQGFIQIEDVGTGQIPGLGVGLRLARDVIRANGGTMSIQSEIDQGTTVTFTLPAVVESAAAA